MKPLTTKIERFRMFIKIVAVPTGSIYLITLAVFAVLLFVKYLISGKITGARFHSQDQVMLFALTVPAIISGGIAAFYLFPVYLKVRKSGRF